jgi:hypothetical protein
MVHFLFTLDNYITMHIAKKKSCKIILHYRSSIPPSCFDHSCDHPHGVALQRIDLSEYYELLCTIAQM